MNADPNVIASLSNNPVALSSYLNSLNTGSAYSQNNSQNYSPNNSQNGVKQETREVSLADSVEMTKKGIAVVKHQLVDEDWVPIIDSYPCCFRFLNPCFVCKCGCFRVSKASAGEGKLKLLEGTCCSSIEEVYRVTNVTKVSSCGFSGLSLKLENHTAVSFDSVKDVDKIKLLLQANVAHGGSAKMSRN